MRNIKFLNQFRDIFYAILIFYLLCLLTVKNKQNFKRTIVSTNDIEVIRDQATEFEVNNEFIVNSTKIINFFKEKDELTAIIKFLVQVNAFVIHIPFLERLDSINLKIKRFNRNLFQVNELIDQVSFGIFNESIQNNLLEENFDDKVH